jgi:starch phosphorylase
LTIGPARLSGGETALYERHLAFDHVIPADCATPRDRYEAVAWSVRDVLASRWLRTEQTYRTHNPKRVYYVSLEFLMGRALANTISNLRLDSEWAQFCKAHRIDPLEIIEQEPDAGLGNGGLGRLAACFLDSMATLGIPAIGSGLRYEYGLFKQSVRDGFSSDRSIAESAKEIWRADACPVD